MPFATSILWALCFLGQILSSSASSSHTFPVEGREWIAEPGTGTIPEIGRGVFWYIYNVTIGLGTPQRGFLVDTGSTDLLLYNTTYKPTKSSHLYKPKPNFNTLLIQTTKFGTGSFVAEGHVYVEKVSAGPFTVPNQNFGNCTLAEYRPKRSTPLSNGIMGFCRKQVSAFDVFGKRKISYSPSFFENLCIQKTLTECRFGVAYGTNNTGAQVLGKLDTSLIKGNVTYFPFEQGRYGFGYYVSGGDISANNEIVLRNRSIIFDTGGPNVTGPLEDVRKVFKALGIQAVEKSNPARLLGYFPCDKPPVGGFSFPAQSDLAKPPPKKKKISATARTFNIAPSEWKLVDNGNNNCTAVVVGVGNAGDIWILGQSAMRSHYLDFNLADDSMGWASLKYPATGLPPSM